MSTRIVKRVARRHSVPLSRHVAVPMPLPHRWPESTVTVIGTGPSLTADDVNLCCGRTRVIAVNNAYTMAPWADALYACDSRWWHWHKGVPGFAGQKYTLDERARRVCPSLIVFRNTGDDGLELKPDGLRTGKNSGYQAINLSVHLGARTILLLGFDMHADPKGKSHFFGEHPIQTHPPFALMIPKFRTLVGPLTDLGIKVINCTPNSALRCFPSMSLQDALAQYAQPQLVSA